MKILQLDANHPLLTEKLLAAGFAVKDDFHSDYESVLAKIRNYDGIILRSRIPIDGRFIRNSNLKFIARVGAGMENIDQTAASEMRVQLINAPEGNRDALAEHVLGMLLLLMNRLKIASAQVQQGIWLREENRSEELMGKTVGLIGYGHMGKATARRLSGFGVKVIFYDILEGLGDGFAQQVTMAELQQRADVLSLHIPLTLETRYLVNEKFIAEMAKPFYLVNTARGQNVDSAAVVAALKNGKIKAAALDVLEFEKSSFENLETQPEVMKELLMMENVLLTPHIAGWSLQSKIKMAEVIADKIIARFPV